jgi:Na+/H+ antiporter NhaD/arsenite permease-like protein
MSVQILSLIVLVCMFVLASFLSVNLGIMALVAAFLIGSIAGGLDTDALVSGFPGDLFILIVGVTYLFTLAQENGTLQRIIDVSMRAVGHRISVIPWLMFLLAAFVAAAGALSAAAVAIVAPIALRFAAQHRVSPLLMGLMVVQGATAGSFSPLSPFGAITNGLLTDNDLPTQPMGLFVNSLLFNIVMAVVVFAVFGGIQLVRERRRSLLAEPATARHEGPGAMTSPEAVSTAAEEPEELPVTTVTDLVHQVVTLVAIVGVVASTMLWGLDVGFVALTAAVVISLLSPERYGECVKRVPWSAVLLVCGVITYVGVLEQIGTIDYLSDLLTSGGNPLLTALAACYIGGVISAFASTAGVLGASIPLAVPVLEQGMLPMLGTVSAIGISSSVVDVSPLSTNGALLVANQSGMETKVFFRRLLLWSVFVITVAPLLAWLIFVVL